MRIALLEDDPAQVVCLIETLSSAGHVCHGFSKGRRLVHTLRRQTFDLLVLNREVSDMSGEDVLRWVRQHLTESLPVIFVTAHGSEGDIMSVLNAGADDYVIMPVSSGVLLARVASLLRRAYRVKPGTTRETFGDLEFDLSSVQAWRKGVPVPLTPREFALVWLLFQNLGRPVSREHILETVWKQASDIQSRTMDTHISLLRTKLGLRPEKGYRLAPVYGFGYRLEKLAVNEAVPGASRYPR